MKRYFHFEDIIERDNINLKTPILVAYRESALSPVKELNLILIGNEIHATDRKQELKEKGNIQLDLSTVGDFKNLIELCEKDNEERILSAYTFAVRGRNNIVNLTVNIGNSYMTGFKVKDFYFEDGKFIFDISR